MKVAAIMPTWNQVEFIEEAINSVYPQVDQLIVVDDGSEDGTLDYMDKVAPAGITLKRHADNRGTAEAINTGSRELEDVDLVTWVSSDNIYYPTWRADLEAAFEDDVGVVYSGYRRFDDRGGSLDYYTGKYDPARLINDVNCFFGASFMLRRRVWEEAGPHRGKISHDYDHWLRVEEVCWRRGLKIVSLPLILCGYRVHDKRVTVTRKHEFDAHHWQAEARQRRMAGDAVPQDSIPADPTDPGGHP